MGIDPRSTVDDEAELQRLTDEAHRAIGRYVVAFSQLVYEMRVIASLALNDNLELGDLAFGQATAQQIADSFFGICRYRGDLNEAESNIANQLQTEVGQKITERNKIMHGEWWVGGAIGGSRRILERARLIRVYPNRRQGDFREVENYSIADLDRISGRLIELRRLLDDFGRAAVGLGLRLTDASLSEAGRYRVSDALIAADLPKSGKGGKVVREGPRADELFHGPLFG